MVQLELVVQPRVHLLEDWLDLVLELLLLHMLLLLVFQVVNKLVAMEVMVAQADLVSVHSMVGLVSWVVRAAPVASVLLAVWLEISYQPLVPFKDFHIQK